MSGDAPRRALGAVEVCKSSGSRMWYCGHIAGLASGGKEALVVAFDGDVWARAEYPFSQVRKPPRLRGDGEDHFDPKVGDEVELHILATEHAPAAWALATVKKIKHDFYYVARASPGSARESGEAIVEKDMLRPTAQTKHLADTSLQQEIYKLPQGLHSWMTTPDAEGCFGHIEEQSNLMFIHVQKAGLQLFGDAKAIQRATKLLDVHVKHQVKIQDFQDKRERGLRALETKRSRIEGTGFKHTIELRVDPAFVPRIIGKGGEVIRSLEERYEVNIRILESEEPEGPRVVRIFGNTPEAVEKARLEVEFVEEALDVEPEMYSWVLGRGGRTIQGFKDSCGLVYATLDRDQRTLLLCGTRTVVQEAIAMFETHIMYYPVFHQMDEEMEQILCQLEEYHDYNARYEWNWLRGEEDRDRDWGNTKGWRGDGGGKGKGKNGKSEARVEAWEPRGKAQGAKGRGKSAAEDEERRPKGKGEKGGKGGKKGKRAADDEDEEEEEEEDEDDEDEEEEEDAPAAGRQRLGRGRGGRTAAPRNGEAKPGGTGPSGRRMGKKGMRS